MNESSHCSTFSPDFDVVSVPDLGHSNRCILVSLCVNLHYHVTYNVKQPFMCLFAICISSLVWCLYIVYIEITDPHESNGNSLKHPPDA